MEKSFEKRQANWTPSCDDVRYEAEVEACARQIETGILPELPNDFNLVFDPIDHDDPYFSGFISAEQYTWHIAQRQIVVSLPHTSAHRHDVNHIPGYQRMLRYKPFADLAQLAASNALDSSALCKTFAEAYDRLADYMFFLYGDDGYDHIANFPQMRQHLRTLIELAHRNAGYGDEEAQVRHEALFNDIARVFELAEYEEWFDTTSDRIKTL